MQLKRKKLVLVWFHDPYHLVLDDNSIYLSDLPNAPMYEKSYTHPGTIVTTVVTPNTNFMFSGSVDGTVRIWKKFPKGIEFAKHYYAHKGRVVSLVSSYDGSFVASVGEDKSIKIYDVESIDMLRILPLEFQPGPAVWVYNSPLQSPLLAVSDVSSHVIHVFDINESEIKYSFAYHKAPVVGLVYNAADDYVVSLDASGAFQYWCPLDGANPKSRLLFKFQFATDLVCFKKSALRPLSLSMSSDGRWLGVFASDWKVGFLERLDVDVLFRDGKREAAQQRGRVGRSLQEGVRRRAAGCRHLPLQPQTEDGSFDSREGARRGTGVSHQLRVRAGRTFRGLRMHDGSEDCERRLERDVSCSSTRASVCCVWEKWRTASVSST